MDLCFINLYGPYGDRELLWNNFVKTDCLLCNNLIFGGDLNFSVGFSKIWGAKARVDSLSDYFTRLMDGFGLVDIVLAVILPTWSNRRVGGENICKRLDRLLISADLLDFNFHFRQWVGCGGDSDHYPVYCKF